mmetsp:Transcript_63769/g.152395  ORF Transcript_63769/g.152395 Transcript_63769/m.152395 type:complete len:298 (+) Transcript_63769:70-963(+)
MALGTIRGAGGNHEALHAQLGDAVQDAEQGVLHALGDEPRMRAAQQHHDGIPRPGDHRKPLELGEEALHVQRPRQGRALCHVHVQGHDHDGVEYDGYAKPHILQPDLCLRNNHSADNATGEHHQIAADDEDSCVLLSPANHAKLEKHQWSCGDPVDVADDGDLPPRDGRLAHARDLRQIRRRRDGHHEEGHHEGFFVLVPCPQRKQQEGGECEENLHNPCDSVREAIGPPLMLAGLNLLLPSGHQCQEGRSVGVIRRRAFGLLDICCFLRVLQAILPLRGFGLHHSVSGGAGCGARI